MSCGTAALWIKDRSASTTQPHATKATAGVLGPMSRLHRKAWTFLLPLHRLDLRERGHRQRDHFVARAVLDVLYSCPIVRSRRDWIEQSRFRKLTAPVCREVLRHSHRKPWLTVVKHHDPWTR